MSYIFVHILVFLFADPSPPRNHNYKSAFFPLPPVRPGPKRHWLLISSKTRCFTVGHACHAVNLKRFIP